MAGMRLMSAIGVEAEHGKLLVHRLDLLLQCLGRGGVFLDQRRVLLRHLSDVICLPEARRRSDQAG